MHRPLPLLATLLGLAGLLPFLGCGFVALSPETVQGARAAQALAAYGAVILAFLGGVHWGFALPEPSARGERARLLLGVVPALVGWVALLLLVAVDTAAALGLLVAGFAGVIVVEARAARLGLMPPRYLALRYALSAVVLLVLGIVFVLRLAGVHVDINSL